MGPSAWEVVMEYKKIAKKPEQKDSPWPWRIFLLTDLKEDFLIPRNSWVLYRVKIINN